MILPHRGLFKYIIVILMVALSLAGANKKKNASLAMLLCVLPGGGQFYTERYVAGVVVASAELALGYYAFNYHQEKDYDNRNSILWWGLFVFGYSLADAYVGAKMYGFDIESDTDKVSLKFTLKL